MLTDNDIEYDVVEEVRENVPCGVSVTTRYKLADVVVRQDINIIVDKSFAVLGKTEKVA